MTSNLGCKTYIVEPKKLGFNKGDVNALEFDDMKKKCYGRAQESIQARVPLTELMKSSYSIS